MRKLLCIAFLWVLWVLWGVICPESAIADNRSAACIHSGNINDAGNGYQCTGREAKDLFDHPDCLMGTTPNVTSEHRGEQLVKTWSCGARPVKCADGGFAATVACEITLNATIPSTVPDDRLDHLQKTVDELKTFVVGHFEVLQREIDEINRSRASGTHRPPEPTSQLEQDVHAISGDVAAIRHKLPYRSHPPCPRHPWWDWYCYCYCDYYW